MGRLIISSDCPIMFASIVYSETWIFLSFKLKRIVLLILGDLKWLLFSKKVHINQTLSSKSMKIGYHEN